MDIDNVGANQLSHLAVMLKFGSRACDDIRPRRIENHKLIRMECRPNVVGQGEFAALAEQSPNPRRLGKLIDRVSEMGMRPQGENAAADTKCADFMIFAICQSIVQRQGVVYTQFGNFIQGLLATHVFERRGRYRPEFYRLVPENAAEAKPNHSVFNYRLSLAKVTEMSKPIGHVFVFIVRRDNDFEQAARRRGNAHFCRTIIHFGDAIGYYNSGSIGFSGQ